MPKKRTRTPSPIPPPTILQPRVTVILGLHWAWQRGLFACRLLSVVPAICHSVPILIRLVLQFREAALLGEATSLSFESRLKVTETVLAMVWCSASAYLSFVFTDCLMSRWLLNYTPLGTAIRLVTLDLLNGFLTSQVLDLLAVRQDPRLLLPAWIGIATILTGLYHMSQRRFSVRKEMNISISVFSISSFVSMAALLGQLYTERDDFVDIPLLLLGRSVYSETARLVWDLGNKFNSTRNLL